MSIEQEDVTESGASIPTRLRWRVPVEITWLVVTVLADLILLVERAYWFLAIVALLNTLGFWHVLQDRTLPRAPYWLSVAAIFAATSGTLVASILEPTGSASESLFAVAIVIIMVVVFVYALRPRRVPVWPSGSIGPSGNSVAWDEARTRRAHRRSTLITFGTLAMAVAFSTAAVAGASISDSRTERLEAIGTRHEGTIVGPGSEGKIHRKQIDVRFERYGQASTIEIRVDDAGPPYEVGQTVEVLIDPNDPNIYTIRGESNDSRAFVWAFSVCVLCWRSCFSSVSFLVYGGCGSSGGSSAPRTGGVPGLTTRAVVPGRRSDTFFGSMTARRFMWSTSPSRFHGWGRLAESWTMSTLKSSVTVTDMDSSASMTRLGSSVSRSPCSPTRVASGLRQSCGAGRRSQNRTAHLGLRQGQEN